MSELEVTSSQEETNVFESSETNNGFIANLLIEQSLLKKVLKQPLNIKKDDVFMTSLFNKFKRKNHIYYHVSTKEFHVDSTETQGQVYLPLITRDEVNNAISEESDEETVYHTFRLDKETGETSGVKDEFGGFSPGFFSSYTEYLFPPIAI